VQRNAKEFLLVMEFRETGRLGDRETGGEGRSDEMRCVGRTGREARGRDSQGN
jgi:hypothetical protein